MAAFVVSAAFENIEEAFEIGIGIGMWVIDRVADAGLTRHVDHLRNRCLANSADVAGRSDRSTCTNSKFAFCRNKASRDSLQSGIVKVVEVVETRRHRGRQPVN